MVSTLYTQCTTKHTQGKNTTIPISQTITSVKHSMALFVVIWLVTNCDLKVFLGHPFLNQLFDNRYHDYLTLLKEQIIILVIGNNSNL